MTTHLDSEMNRMSKLGMQGRGDLCGVVWTAIDIV